MTGHSQTAKTPREETGRMLVTVRVDKQLLGIPVSYVRDVLKECKVASIPLAPPEIRGSINLRGRIVTAIDVRKRLSLPDAPEPHSHMFVVVELQGQYYSLMVDSVGDVLTIPGNQIEKCPGNLSSHWRDIASGIHRLEDELLLITDVPTLLTF